MISGCGAWGSGQAERLGEGRGWVPVMDGPQDGEKEGEIKQREKDGGKETSREWEKEIKPERQRWMVGREKNRGRGREREVIEREGKGREWETHKDTVRWGRGVKTERERE